VIAINQVDSDDCPRNCARFWCGSSGHRAGVGEGVRDESVDTTQIYLDANLALKERILAKIRRRTECLAVIDPMIRCWRLNSCNDHHTMAGDGADGCEWNPTTNGHAVFHSHLVRHSQEAGIGGYTAPGIFAFVECPRNRLKPKPAERSRTVSSS
jgi:hypothetical protein